LSAGRQFTSVLAKVFRIKTFQPLLQAIIIESLRRTKVRRLRTVDHTLLDEDRRFGA